MLGKGASGVTSNDIKHKYVTHYALLSVDIDSEPVGVWFARTQLVLKQTGCVTFTNAMTYKLFETFVCSHKWAPNKIIFP